MSPVVSSCVLYETRKLVKCVIMLDGGCRALSRDALLLRRRSRVSSSTGVPVALFSPRDSSFPLSYFPLSLSLSLSLSFALPLPLVPLPRASQGYATVVLDHTWRAKLSLLTLGRDTKPEDRLGSSSKVDNNVTPNIPRGPEVTTSPRAFPRPGPSPGGLRGIFRGRRSNGDAV